MVRPGSSAPAFDGCAIMDGTSVDLTWRQIHQEQVLVLVFDSVMEPSDLLDDLSQAHVDTTAAETSDIRMFLVGRDPLFELQTSDLTLPVLVDTDGDIASRYDMLTGDGRPLWGQCIADANGIVRYLSGCDRPGSMSATELLRYSTAIAEGTDDC